MQCNSNATSWLKKKVHKIWETWKISLHAAFHWQLLAESHHSTSVMRRRVLATAQQLPFHPAWTGTKFILCSTHHGKQIWTLRHSCRVHLCWRTLSHVPCPSCSGQHKKKFHKLILLSQQNTHLWGIMNNMLWWPLQIDAHPWQLFA